jgi:hypothetical protein
LTGPRLLKAQCAKDEGAALNVQLKLALAR